MSKVNFVYNLKKDAESWVEIAQDKNNFYGISYNDQTSFIPAKLLTLIQKIDKESAVNLVVKHLKQHSKKKLRERLTDQVLNSVSILWPQIENKYFQRLKKIIQRPTPAKQYTCYLTSGFMCPDNKKKDWFMISIWQSLSKNITTIAHEILHSYFLYHYEQYCNEYLTEQQLDVFKEAMTFLLNVEFNDLLLTEDKGYPAHQELRTKLEKLWNKNRNFEKFLNEFLINKYGYLRF